MLKTMGTKNMTTEIQYKMYYLRELANCTERRKHGCGEECLTGVE